MISHIEKSDIGLPASRLLLGLADVAARKQINVGDEVLHRHAVNGGWRWERARVTKRYPIGFNAYRFDIRVETPLGPKDIQRVHEISLRAIKP